MHQSSLHKTEGLLATKLMITLLEHLRGGALDHSLPTLLGLCLQELTALSKRQKHYQLMLLQVLCLSFWYNCALTFSILEQNQWTLTVFHRLLIMLPRVHHTFELRRVIFGLTAIVETANGCLEAVPEIVQARITDVVQYLVQMCVKMEDERVKEVRVKEKENGCTVTGMQSDEEYEEESDGEEDEDEEEFNNTNKRILELLRKNRGGAFG